MNNSDNISGKGVTALDLLAIVFIVLKLLGKISWSWLWVLSPIWIPILILAIVSLILVIVEYLRK